MVVLEWELQLRYFLIPSVFNTPNANMWNAWIVLNSMGFTEHATNMKKKTHITISSFIVSVLVQPPAFKSTLIINPNAVENIRTKYFCVTLLWIRSNRFTVKAKAHIECSYLNLFRPNKLFCAAKQAKNKSKKNNVCRDLNAYHPKYFPKFNFGRVHSLHDM